MEENEETIEIDLKNLLLFLFKKLWIIIAVSILSAGIALLSVVYFVTPRYKSSVKLYVNTGLTLSNISIGGLDAAQSLVKTYIVILETNDTIQQVKEKAINDNPSLKSEIEKLEVDDILNMISAGEVNGTEVFYVSITDTNKERAFALVSAISEILSERVNIIIENASAMSVDSASVPEQVSPRVARTTVIFFLVGALVAVAILFIVYLLDKKIHDEQYIIDNYKIPLLSVVPDLTKTSENKYGKYGKYGKYKYGGQYGYYSHNSNNDKGENGNV